MIHLSASKINAFSGNKFLHFFLICIFTSCTVSQVVHNDSVKQKIIEDHGDSVTVKAGELYQAGKFKRFMLGDHYREVWLAPVKVPVVDFDKIKGGVEILDKGGGMQTYSLKLKAKDDRLYALRSVQKDPTSALPFALQYSFVDDIVQDQMSSANPYGALVIPVLADAAGIYHTNPELVFIPDTPELGKYREDFGGMLALLEEDADEDWSGYEDFGGTENAVSTETMMEKVTDDHDDMVDDKNLLRARIFDMWINDWDRHEGQFRWAELEGEDGDIYRPIPEDRDNAFFKADGFLPWWVSRKWAVRKFQDFRPEVRDVLGLNLSGSDLDRRFLAWLGKPEWIAVIDELKDNLTDEVIEKAMYKFPDTVRKIVAPEMTETLKGRRENLDKFVMRYYDYITEEVDLVGSNKDEYFEIIHRPGNNVEVLMYDSDDGKKDKLLKKRLFFDEETKEINIYGLKGDDSFYISGTGKKSPKIRIIGGEGEDILVDSSRVKKHGKQVIYYDFEGEENEIEEGRETKLKISDDLNKNNYDYEGHSYNYLGPSLYFGLNDDDGIFFGGGVNITTHSFRKEPFASRHHLVANFAPRTKAWNFAYKGEFVEVVDQLGLDIDLLVRAPNYFTNFYGYGNETEPAFGEDDNLYRIRYEEILFFPGLKTGIGEKTSLKFGPVYEFAQVNSGQSWLFDLPVSSPDDIFQPAHFAGLGFEADVNTTEIINKPEKGIHWTADLQWMTELNNDNSKIGRFESSFSAYYTLDLPLETTFAVRIGGASVAGDFNFYQASTIGGNAGLSRLGTVRGYSRDRYAGRSSIYQNNEIRMRLLALPFYYMPFEIGISGHFDMGRVWYDNEDSDEWHSGAGGGLWIAPLGRWVFTAVYTKGEEEGIYNLNLGFLF